MQPKTKKIIFISSALLLVGGGIDFWIYNKNKNKSTETSAETLPDATIGTPTTGKPAAGSQNVQAALANIPAAQPVKPILVPAKDLLAGNINGANRKAAFAVGSVKVFNMSGGLAFTAKKNEYLGLVISARASGSTFIITVLKNNVKYYFTAINVYIKTN